MLLVAKVLFIVSSKPDSGPPRESRHYSIRPPQYSVPCSGRSDVELVIERLELTLQPSRHPAAAGRSQVPPLRCGSSPTGTEHRGCPVCPCEPPPISTTFLESLQRSVFRLRHAAISWA